jgi:hypothetical protein
MGRKHAGCLRQRRNAWGSTVGINAKNQRAIKTTTAVVDHGREAATKAGYKSTQRSQNGDRVADKKSENIRARPGVDLRVASNIFIRLQSAILYGARSGRFHRATYANSAATVDCKSPGRPLKLHDGLSHFQRTTGLVKSKDDLNGIIYRRRQGVA